MSEFQNINRENRINSAKDHNERNPQSRVEFHGIEANSNNYLTDHGFVAEIRENVKSIHKNETILSFFIKDQQTLKNLRKAFRSRTIVILTWGMWVLLSLVGTIVCLQYNVPYKNAYLAIQAIYSVHYILTQLIFLRTTVFQDMLKCFSFWYLAFHTITFHILFVMMWDASSVASVTALHSASSMVVIIFFDAHIYRSSNVIKLCSVFGVMTLICPLVVLQFSLVDLQSEAFYYEPKNIELINLRLQASDSLTVIIIYIIRILYLNVIKGDTTRITFLSQNYSIRRLEHDEQINLDVISATRPLNSFWIGLKRIFLCFCWSRSITSVANLSSESVTGQDPDLVGDNGAPVASGGAKISRSQNMTNSGQRSEFLVMGVVDHDKFFLSFADNLFHSFSFLANYQRDKKTKFGLVYNRIGMIALAITPPVSFCTAIGLIQNTHLNTFVTLLGSTCSLFVMSQIIFMSNKAIFHRMLSSFDYWYVLFLNAKMLVSAGLLCGLDHRFACWIYMSLIVQWLLCIDSLIQTDRRWSWFGMAVGLWYLCVGITCKLGIGSIYDSEANLTLSGVTLFSARISLSGAAFSISLFALRFLWSYHQNDKRLLFVTAPIKLCYQQPSSMNA